MIPPWPVFWLVSAVAIYVPGFHRQWAEELGFLVGLTDALPGMPGSVVTSEEELLLNRIVTVVDLLPAVVILAAVAAVAAVPLRRRLVHRSSEPPIGIPAMVGAERHLQQIAPDVEIRFRPQGGVRAQTYPRGIRRSGILVTSELLLLWDRDRELAEAVLRHEVAHCRRGDPLLLGALSPLTHLLRGLPWLVLGFGIVPQLAMWRLTTTENGLSFTDHTGFLSGQFLTIVLPGLTATFLVGIAQVMAILTMPIAASWSAELTADHSAGAGCDDLDRAFAPAPRPVPVPGSPHDRRNPRLRHPRLRDPRLHGPTVTHPPRWLRRRFVSASGTAQRLTAVLLYPAAWVVQLGWLLLMAVAVQAQTIPSNGSALLWDQVRQILRDQVDHVGIWVRSHPVLWAAAAVFVLVWTRVGPWCWSRLFSPAEAGHG